MENVAISVEVQTMETTKKDSHIACTVCGKLFSDLSNCRKHTLRHGQNKGNECEICHHLFQGRQQKLQHMMFEHGEDCYEYKCQVCGVIFNKLDDLHIHANTVHETGKQCKICNKKISTTPDYIKHMGTHVEDGSALQCLECKKFFRDISNLRIHMRSHTGEKPFECPDCPQKFAARMYLFRHIETYHMLETPYHCELCNVSFKTIIQLRSHVKTKMHIRKQNNLESTADRTKEVIDKQYVCPHCGKTFAQQTYLTVHQRTHSDVKPYYCPVCSKGFVQVGNMYQHIKRTHQPKIISQEAKDDMFKCKQCNEIFTTRREHKFHMSVHKKEKVYTCQVCQKAFNTKANLINHEGQHNPKSTIKCVGCHKVFFSWSNLRRHHRCCWSYKTGGIELPDDDDTIKEEIDTYEEAAEPSAIEDVENSTEDLTKVIKTEAIWNEDAVAPRLRTSGGYSVIKIQQGTNDQQVVLESQDYLKINLSGIVSLDDITVANADSENQAALQGEVIEEMVTIEELEDSHGNFEPEDIIHDNTSYQSNYHNSKTPNQSNSNDQTGEVIEILPSQIKTEVPEEVNDLKEIKPEVDSFDTGNKSSQVVFYQIEDKIVEIQYLYPPAPVVELEEEVVTTGVMVSSSNHHTEAETDTADVIASLVDNSAQVVQVQSLGDDYNVGMSNMENVQANDHLIYSPDKRRVEQEVTKSDPSFIIHTSHQFICPICEKVFHEKGNLRHHVKRHNQNKGNECDVCRKLFQGRQQVFQHKMMEHSIRPALIQCEICDMEQSSIADLRQHCECAHGQDYPFECTFCFKRYSDKVDYQFHVKFHKKEFQCDRCDKSYDNQTALTAHFRSHTGERPYECSTCFKTYSRLSHLRIHNYIHLDVRPFTCPDCGKGFLKKSVMEQHQRIHSKVMASPQGPPKRKRKPKPNRPCDKIYKCPYCEKGFNQTAYLTIHIRTHTGNHPYSCPVCSKTFVQNGNMLKHLRSRHTKKQVNDWIKCEGCSALFRTQHELHKHMKTLHSKCHECEVCDAIFESVKALKMHRNSHSKLTDIQCTLCHAKLGSKESLRKHMANHNEPSTSCSICGTYFETKHGLTKHMHALHNHKDTFECETCHKRYSDIEKLDAHMKNHRKKLFECLHCDKFFHSEKVMKEHLRKVKSKDQHQCHICSKVFTGRSSLVRHFKLHENKDIEADDINTSAPDIVPESSSSNILSAAISDSPKQILRNLDKFPNMPIKIVISENSFECVDCKEQYLDKKAFLDHVKTHTSIEYVLD